MNTDLQQMIIQQAIKELREARNIVGQVETKPEDVGRSESATCRCYGHIMQAQNWLDKLEENL